MIESSGKLQVHELTSGAAMKVKGKFLSMKKIIFSLNKFQQISYVKDNVMSATRWVNFFAFLWFTQFLYGCQDFIIAGSVSKWFFTRNKNKLSLPILMSFGHLIRYHLGSVSLGSILIATIQLVRTTLKWIEVRSKFAIN